jgi:hypothetical protein
MLRFGARAAVRLCHEEATMNAIKRAVVVALLAVWCFPAVSLAKPEAARPAPLPAVVTSTAAPRPRPDRSTEVRQLAAREQRAQDLQDFKGGQEYVSIYIGSGVLLVAVIILLLLLI